MSLLRSIAFHELHEISTPSSEALSLYAPPVVSSTKLPGISPSPPPPWTAISSRNSFWATAHSSRTWKKKRLQKCLQRQGFDVVHLLSTDVVGLCQNFNDFPDRHAHDMFSENDIKIFRIPEGMLSTEQGVYIAASISAKNTKQPKCRCI
nr:eIF-2-alpha kinase activator GCN1 isoform X7 [Ipomoea trifida]